MKVSIGPTDVARRQLSLSTSIKLHNVFKIVTKKISTKRG